jgi:hypothetical protein
LHGVRMKSIMGKLPCAFPTEMSHGKGFNTRIPHAADVRCLPALVGWIGTAPQIDREDESAAGQREDEPGSLREGSREIQYPLF